MSDINLDTRKQSLRLSAAMDAIGFSEEEISLIRSELNVSQVMLYPNWFPDDQYFMCFSGSRTEAVTGGVYGSGGDRSDVDLMYVWKCFNKIEEEQCLPTCFVDQKHLIRIIDTDTHPGYTLLELVRLGEQSPLLQTVDEFCVVDASARTMVCPEKIKCVVDFKTRFDKTMDHWQFLVNSDKLHIQGPSVAATNSFLFDSEFSFESDTVMAIISSWPKQAEEWQKRQRCCDWPDRDTIEGIVTNGCLIVPTGYSLSDKKDLEWRFSFSTAETLLVRNFNCVQMKCYGLLKIIMNDEIKPVLPGILCSYYMKTLMFWMIEETGSSLWEEGKLLSFFLSAINRLQTWINNENIPNYFIPKNNMLQHKLHLNFKEKLKIVLENIKRHYWKNLEASPSFNEIASTVFDSQMSDMEVSIQMGHFTFNSVLHRLSSIDTCLLGILEFAIAELFRKLLLKQRNDSKKYHELTLESILQDRSALEEKLLKPFIGFIQSSLAVVVLSVNTLNEESMSNTLQEVLSVIEKGAESDLFCGPLRCASFLYGIKLYQNVLNICNNVSAASHDRLLTGQLLVDVFTRIHKSYRNVSDKLLKESDVQLYFQFRDDVRNLCKTGIIEDTSYLKHLDMDVGPCYVHGMFGCDVFFTTNDFPVATPPAIAYELLCRALHFGEWIKESELPWIQINPFVYARYLAYMAYKRLGDELACEKTLSDLEFQCENLDKKHKAISLNLLGYCCVAQGHVCRGFQLFFKSLRIEPTKMNAACWYIAIMVSRFVIEKG